MSNIIKIFSLVISIVIGAGFASGKELFTFFGLLRENYLEGLIFCSFLFFILIYGTLEIARKNKTTTYNQFLNTLFKNKTIISFFEKCIIFFMFVCFSSMVAGFTSLMSQALNIDKIYTIIFFVVLNFIFLLKGYNYIIKLSIILVPTILICAIYFCFLFLETPREFTIALDFLPNIKTIANTSLYTSYNLITVIAIISTIPELYSNKKNNLISSVAIAITLFILSMAILNPMSSYFSYIQNKDMPIFSILILEYPNLIKYYLIIMIFATLSTSLSNCYGVTMYFVENHKTNYFLASFFVILLGTLFSLVGFSNIVNLIYPIFGFFGIIKMTKIFIIYLLG